MQEVVYPGEGAGAGPDPGHELDALRGLTHRQHQRGLSGKVLGLWRGEDGRQGGGVRLVRRASQQMFAVFCFGNEDWKCRYWQCWPSYIKRVTSDMFAQKSN